MFGVVVGVQGRPAGQHSRTEPRGQDEKGAMAGIRMEPRRQTWRDHFGSVRGGRPGGRGKTRRRPRKTRGQKDRRRRGWVGAGGKERAGTSPAGELAHLPCCHTNEDTIRVGLKDGGWRFFFCQGKEW